MTALHANTFLETPDEVSHDFLPRFARNSANFLLNVSPQILQAVRCIRVDFRFQVTPEEEVEVARA